MFLIHEIPSSSFFVLLLGGKIFGANSVREPQLSVEIMVTIAALKSAIAWIWTWVINDFVTASGALSVFMTVGAINVAIYLTYIPFYYRGKQIRMWIHKAKSFRATGLQ
jgi:hypothetical protein